MPSANFFSNAEFLYFVETLRLLVQPHLFQRARYEKELKKDLRYIAVPDDGTITMGVKTTDDRVLLFICFGMI